MHIGVLTGTKNRFRIVIFLKSIKLPHSLKCVCFNNLKTASCLSGQVMAKRTTGIQIHLVRYILVCDRIWYFSSSVEISPLSIHQRSN